MDDYLATLDIETGHLNAYFGGTEHCGYVILPYGDFIVDKKNISSLSKQEMCQRLLEKWLKHKENLNAYVHGNYSLGIWSPVERLLFFTQDSLSQKTVFYTKGNGSITFSNRLEHVLRTKQERNLSDDFFASWLTGTAYRSQTTPFLDIYRLREGSTLILKNGRERIFHVDYDNQSVGAYNAKNASEELRSLVTEAIDVLACPKHDPIYELSGGLDSTTVIAVASKRVKQDRLNTFTWSSPSDDDHVFASIATQELGINNIEIPIPAVNEASFLSKTLPRMEPWNELAPDSRDHFSLLNLTKSARVISGVGGDDVFLSKTSIPYWLNDLMRKGAFRRAYRLCQSESLHRFGQRSAEYLFLKFALSPFLINPTSNKKFRYLDTNKYPSDFIKTCQNQLITHPARNRSRLIGKSEYFERILHTVFHRVYPEHMDSNSRYSHPLLYQPLVNFMSNQIGMHEKSLNSDRDLQRHAFEGIIPQKILTRRSKGGGLERDWTLINQKWFQDLLTSSGSQMEARGYLRDGALLRIIRKAKLGDFGDLSEYDFAIKGELWLRHFNSHVKNL